MGTISVPKSPECDQGFMRPPAEERENSATRVSCHTPSAECLADHSQVEDPGGDGYGKLRLNGARLELVARGDRRAT